MLPLVLDGRKAYGVPNVYKLNAKECYVQQTSINKLSKGSEQRCFYIKLTVFKKAEYLK